MLIEGYGSGPLVAGEALVGRPGFWSNHLLGWCGSWGADHPVPEWFGEDVADAEALSDTLMDPERWPVLRVPYEGGRSAVVIYRNLVGDFGVDYLLTDPAWPLPRRIASWEGGETCGVFTWSELIDIVDGSAPGGVTDPAARLLLLLPLLDGSELPGEEPLARITAALISIGTPPDTAPLTARELSGCSGQGVWRDSGWRLPSL